MVEVRPEQYLGLVTVKGTGLPKPKAIAFTDPGKKGIDNGFFKRRGQVVKAYGERFVVPAGEWDLWIQPADGSKAFCLEQKATIKPGVLTVIE